MESVFFHRVDPGRRGVCISRCTRFCQRRRLSVRRHEPRYKLVSVTTEVRGCGGRLVKWASHSRSRFT